jgi:hypothetical protein
MKYLFINLVKFFIPIILFIILFDWLISKELNQSNLNEGEFEVWNDIYSKKLNTSVAIYGSSRAWVHFNPKIIEQNLKLKTYNFGVDGQNFEIQNLRHKKFISNNVKPKLIILSLDVFTLGEKESLYNSDQFLPYMLFDIEYHKYLKNYKNFNTYDFFVPSVRFFGKAYLIENLLIKSDLNYRNKGFKGQNRFWEMDNVNLPQYYYAKISRSIYGHLKSFLIEMKKENIKIILVYSPEYIKGQKFTKNRREVLKLFNNLALSQQIPFFDYSDDSMSFQKKYFYNSEHLNSLGANVFTNKFCKDIKQFITN